MQGYIVKFRVRQGLSLKGGTDMIKAYRDVLPKWVTFPSKFLDMGFTLAKKIIGKF